MTSWTHLTLPCPPQKQDLLIGHLELLGISGFVQGDAAVSFYVAGKDWTRELAERVRTSAHKALGTPVRLRVETVKDQNWNAQWERSMKIVRATDRIIIRPSWKKVRGSTRGKIVITIDPKMSFGTGHHETTRLSLRLLEEFMPKRATVLDFGTGSGVLAIAAARLGAKKVDAIDNDPWAVENAEENIRMNTEGRARGKKQEVRRQHVRVRGEKQEVRRVKVRVVKGSVRAIPGKHYDCVVANIDLPTIRRFLRSLLTRTKKGGVVILSGVLMSDLVPLLELLLDLPVTALLLEHEGEWLGIAVRKDEHR